MGTHSVHPRCHICNKALHRTPTPGVRARKGPQIYCRNKECEINKKEARNESSREKLIDNLRNKGLLERVKEEPKEKPVPVENKKQSELRKTVHSLLNIDSEKVKSYLLVLIVMAQELGEQELADKMVKRFGFGKYFGN